MIKRILFISYCTITCYVAYPQNAALSVFDHLIGKTWKAEGTWANGTPFLQETSFEWGLNQTIVLAKSKGFIDQEQTTYGERNFGIRSFDREKNEIVFSEYDVFGGVTKGTVSTQDKSMTYVYEYGGAKLADVWEYVNDSTYAFTVKNHQNDSQKIYIKTEFRIVKNKN